MIAPGRGTAKKGKVGTASPVGALAHPKLSMSSFAGAAVQRFAAPSGVAGVARMSPAIAASPSASSAANGAFFCFPSSVAKYRAA